jgi:hypothetical protein
VLYAPETYERLTTTPWQEARVREGIRAVVADADAAYDADAMWPAHEWDGWRSALPLKNLYVGAAGMAWGLDTLLRRGVGETGLEPAAVAREAFERFRAEPDFLAGEELPAQKHSSLLNGEAGVLLVAWLLAPEDSFAGDLLALVRQNVGNEANELMWGVPGTLLVARTMLSRTGEERWRVAVQESEDALRDSRDGDGLWTQHLYGRVHRILGPPHGLVGNVAALGEVGSAADVLARTAIVQGDHANWPSAADGPDEFLRLQWCNGAPGIVITAAGYLDEELLLAGAQLIWDAGPHGDEKGAGICHGTAGNGYALLKTFERTGDELWLERARAFAMHALEQAQRLAGR